MLEGTLFEVARSSVLCAFGFDADIFGNDLGAVPYYKYENRMNISPNSPKGPMTIGISAWLLSSICPILLDLR